ncbi:putative extracellular tyrosine-protein kinase PKDCC [Apostichopus japonicus]|uniref:Putative extracellular tyrosine-protein kinase PKDCC n=1 Tax=Stichopus japonicus TaxID=307972 RepID=A0A2G8K2T7_STIJA|nr:putative extracellular tyrosine-protein kinase PKDCC [Apostichopus japonicus]
MVLDRPVGRGTTKTAFKSTFAGQTVVVKMVTDNVKDIVACKKKKGAHNINSCFKFAQYKIMKEIALLEQLRHPNVAQLLGSCIRNEVDKNDRVMVVMELGKPVDIRKMGWPMQLQVSLNMAELLHYFHNSPIGSIRIGDFKRDQFRLINGTVKISDLDDLTVEEQSCDVRAIVSLWGRITVSASGVQGDGGEGKGWGAVNIPLTIRVG